MQTLDFTSATPVYRNILWAEDSDIRLAYFDVANQFNQDIAVSFSNCTAPVTASGIFGQG